MMKVLTFRVAGELYGLEIARIREINRNVEYTVVPRAPVTIVGLFNMRGQIVTLFNMARMLGSSMICESGTAICIILKTSPDHPNPCGFLIDQTGDVADLEDEVCEAPPANSDRNGQRLMKRIARLDGELVRIIDPDRLQAAWAEEEEGSIEMSEPLEVIL